MPAAKKLEKREAIKKLAMQGMNNVDIAAALGFTRSSVSHLIFVLKKEGQIPDRATRQGRPPGIQPVSHVRRLEIIHQSRRGKMFDVLLPLTEKQRAWLFKQVPEGGTVADVLRSLVIDAYEEETNA